MIEQYLSNTNESATIPILQNFLELNKAQIRVIFFYETGGPEKEPLQTFIKRRTKKFQPKKQQLKKQKKTERKEKGGERLQQILDP